MAKALSVLFVAALCLWMFNPGKLSAQQSSSEERILSVNFNDKPSILDTSFKECVGAGRANEGLRADWQRQLRIAKKECGFHYIRFHGLLTDDMGVYKEDRHGNPQYNYQYIDELFDFLLSVDVKPFVELGFMPRDLASGSQTVFWWKGNITPPKDYVKWDNLIKNLIKHWTERYGEKEVALWYFEIWNEPNLKGLFFTGDQQDYFKLYRETAEAIKSVSPHYRVGGPASAGNTWIPAMLDFCSKSNTPIDFITAHEYSVLSGHVDTSGRSGTIINPDKNAVAEKMRQTREMILNSKLSNLGLHYTEWSSSYTPTDPMHDTYEQAPFILNVVKKASPFANSMSYWTFTDIFEELGPRFEAFHGGFGLLNYQDIRKPAFYAFKFLNELGKYEYSCGDSSAYACKDVEGNIQLLFWNCTIDHPDDNENDQQFYKQDIPAKPVAPVRINLNGIASGNYIMKVFKTGYHINDPYSTYIAMGSPAQLTFKQVEYIKTMNDGKPVEVKKISINGNGKFVQNFPMNRNDVCFVTIEKAKH